MKAHYTGSADQYQALHMPVIEISETEFTKRRPLRGPDVGTHILERAWFATEDGSLLGVVTFDATDQDWGYIVLGGDQEGRFRAIDLEHSRTSLARAKDELIAAMTETEASSQTTFPQDDI